MPWLAQPRVWRSNYSMRSEEANESAALYIAEG